VSWRRALCLIAVLAAARNLHAQQAPPSASESEEAADFARRAALSALHGPPKLFLDALDADGILRRAVGSPAWGALAARQRESLRGFLRGHFLEALGSRGGGGEVSWISVSPAEADGAVPVNLGLSYGASSLKTRWITRRSPRGWAIEDVRLSDPGISLADEVRAALGPQPLVPKNTAREARSRALPRILALVGIALVVGVAAPRLSAGRRRLLYLMAAVPALLLAVDGGLAVHRARSESFALTQPAAEPWREREREAMAAEDAGQPELAREAWRRAIGAGAPAGPILFRLGAALRGRGDLERAEDEFHAALAASPPAPGAGRELAMLALARGRSDEARRLLVQYLAATGPDPDSLAALAVAETNLGAADAAVRTIDQAADLVLEGTRRAELRAQIHARTGDAAGAVVALRPLDAAGTLDRAALRADPAYLPIAADPAWVAFLNEGKSK
jgi:tetratricopeptide (TPR) repeat protein